VCIRVCIRVPAGQQQLCARAQERQRELEEAQRKLQEREDMHEVLLQERQDKHEEHMKQAQREHEERMSYDKQRFKEQETHMKQQETHMKQQETQRTASLDALQVLTISDTLNTTPYTLQGRLDSLEESEEFEPAWRMHEVSKAGRRVELRVGVEEVARLCRCGPAAPVFHSEGANEVEGWLAMRLSGPSSHDVEGLLDMGLSGGCT
jgi:hypothetical protein